MVRDFTDEDRERIRKQLVETAHEQFSRYGIEKTTISDLTEPVGIANSTFYSFFDSKGALYVEILQSQAEETAARVLGASFEEYDDPQRAIEAFLEAVCAEIETNPLTRRLIAEGEVNRLREAAGPETVEQSRKADIAYFLPYVESYFEADELRGPDPETIAHATRAVTFVTLHREDIGEDRYEAVRDLLISAFAAGITTN